MGEMEVTGELLEARWVYKTRLAGLDWRMGVMLNRPCIVGVVLLLSETWRRREGVGALK